VRAACTCVFREEKEPLARTAWLLGTEKKAAESAGLRAIL